MLTWIAYARQRSLRPQVAYAHTNLPTSSEDPTPAGLPTPGDAPRPPKRIWWTILWFQCPVQVSVLLWISVPPHAFSALQISVPRLGFSAPM